MHIRLEGRPAMRKTRPTHFLFVLTLTSILLSPNCATLTRSRTQRIPVTSSPTGAAVFVNGVEQGVTPLEIKLAREEKGQVIRIESPGFNPVEIRPKRNISILPIFGNVLIAAACGITTAAVWSHAHDEDIWGGFKAMTIGFGAICGFTGLFTLLDVGFTKGYEFNPRELTVTLTKADGPPRVDVMLIDSDDLQNIKWIRVHRD
jgi:hypothetical protein